MDRHLCCLSTIQQSFRAYCIAPSYLVSFGEQAEIYPDQTDGDQGGCPSVEGEEPRFYLRTKLRPFGASEGPSVRLNRSLHPSAQRNRSGRCFDILLPLAGLGKQFRVSIVPKPAESCRTEIHGFFSIYKVACFRNQREHFCLLQIGAKNLPSPAGLLEILVDNQQAVTGSMIRRVSGKFGFRTGRLRGFSNLRGQFRGCVAKSYHRAT